RSADGSRCRTSARHARSARSPSESTGSCCRLLATGGPQFRLGLGSFLVRGPDRLARLFLLEGDALDLRGDPVEGGGKTEALALRFVGAAGTKLLDHAVGLLEALADGRVYLLVADLDPELVGDGLEHELAGDRALCLRAET